MSGKCLLNDLICWTRIQKFKNATDKLLGDCTGNYWKLASVRGGARQGFLFVFLRIAWSQRETNLRVTRWSSLKTSGLLHGLALKPLQTLCCCLDRMF